MDAAVVGDFVAAALGAIERRDPADHRAILAELERGARLRVVIDELVGRGGPMRIRLRLLRLEGRNRWLWAAVLPAVTADA